MRPHHRLPWLVFLLPFLLTMCSAPPPPAPPTSSPPSNLAPSSAPTLAVPTPTIVYYKPNGGAKPWDIIPTIVISSAADDPRIPLVQKAVDYWNEQFKGIGTPFHIGSITQTTIQFPGADLQAISNPDTPGKLSSASTKLLNSMPGDLVIALSNANFVSVTLAGGKKRLIAIQGHPGGQDSDIINMNVIAHEMGHAMGLGHNSDPSTLMCGRPSPCRPGVDQFVGITGFAPLTDAEKALLLKLYPQTWKPSP
jgi:hypothetical protein